MRWHVGKVAQRGHFSMVSGHGVRRFPAPARAGNRARLRLHATPLIVLLTFSSSAGLWPVVSRADVESLAAQISAQAPGRWCSDSRSTLGFPHARTVIGFTNSRSIISTKAGAVVRIFLVTLAVARRSRANSSDEVGDDVGWRCMISLLLIIFVVAYASTRQEGIHWQPWMRSALRRLRAEGRAVLVDFTADWCLTCQLNSRHASTCRRSAPSLPK